MELCATRKAAPLPPPGTAGRSPWAQRALDDEVARVVAAPGAAGNDQLNKSAFSLGQLVAGGELDEGDVYTLLMRAATGGGRRTEREARRTIESGLRAGAAHPRTAPPREERTAEYAEKPPQAGGSYSASSAVRSSQRKWPDPLEAAAFHGLAGDVVRAVEPHSEADPVAVLVVFLAEFGSLIGPAPHHLVGETRHPARLFPVLVGKTAKGRKGEAQSQVDAILGPLDPDWAGKCHGSGLASGEGLIYHVRDAEWKQVTDKKTGETVDVLVDAGVVDKRLVIVEAEFGRTLRVGHRDGNTLSPVVRYAWDDKALRNMTKNSPLVATGAHVTVIGHITTTELAAEMTSADLANGLANRFLPVCVERSKVLARPARMPADVRRALQERIGKAVISSRQRSEVPLSAAATGKWDTLYGELSADRDGLVGALTARAEPYVLRIALTFALLDCAPEIRPEHLDAAIALWRYVERSIAYVFGEMTGNPTADAILTLLRQQSPLSQAAINDAFSGHVSAARIGAALELLTRLGRVRSKVTHPTDARGGRPRTDWELVQ